jgi:hypothetical protein
MIPEATLAVIMAIGNCPATQERGWVKLGVPIVTPGRELTEGQIMNPGQAWRETDGAFIHFANVAISRQEWIDAQLEAYSSLEVGWDGPDSQPPQAAHIAAARAILWTLPAGTPIPKPMLSSGGELGLYWEEPEWMADIAIEGENEFSLFFRSRDRKVEVLKSGLPVGSESSALIKDTLILA